MPSERPFRASAPGDMSLQRSGKAMLARVSARKFLSFSLPLNIGRQCRYPVSLKLTPTHFTLHWRILQVIFLEPFLLFAVFFKFTLKIKVEESKKQEGGCHGKETLIF